MKDKIKNTIKYIVLRLCMTAEVFYFIFTVIGLFLFVADPEPPMPVPAIITMTLHSVGLFVISVIGLRRINNGHKWIITPNFALKLLLTWFEFGFMCLFIGDDAYIVTVFVFIIGLIAIGITLLIKYANRRIKLQRQGYMIKIFDCDKAEFHLYSATSEYCRLYSKNPSELSADENAELYYYASNSIVYFLAWIIKNNFLSDEFIRSHNSDLINDIKNERTDPVKFFASEMNYTLSRYDLSQYILGFVNNYYYDSHNMIYSHCTMKYGFDYYEITKYSDGILYCSEFSWEKYYKIENRINERYQYYSVFYEKCIEIPNRKVRWNLLNAELQLETANCVSDEYIDSCIKHLNNLSDDFIDELCDKLIYLTNEERPDIINDKRKILDYVHPYSIIINTPQNDEPAFIIGCESDFEYDDDIAVTVRNGINLYTDFYSAAESPWSYDNEIAYKIAASVKNINRYDIDTVEKAEKAVETGILAAIYPIHSTQQPNNDQKILVPPVVAYLKHKYDMMIEYLLFQGRVNNYSCYPTYKDNSIMPSELHIKAQQDNQIVFEETIYIR